VTLIGYSFDLSTKNMFFFNSSTNHIGTDFRRQFAQLLIHTPCIAENIANWSFENEEKFSIFFFFSIVSSSRFFFAFSAIIR